MPRQARFLTSLGQVPRCRCPGARSERWWTLNHQVSPRKGDELCRKIHQRFRELETAPETIPEIVRGPGRSPARATLETCVRRTAPTPVTMSILETAGEAAPEAGIEPARAMKFQ